MMPKITAYLTKQAQTSVKAGLNYTQSLNYKLQLAYLQGLGPLCVSLDLGMSVVIFLFTTYLCQLITMFVSQLG